MMQTTLTLIFCVLKLKMYKSSFNYNTAYVLHSFANNLEVITNYSKAPESLLITGINVTI